MADGLTIGINRIELKDEQQREPFEQLMYEKVFPDLLSDGFAQPEDRQMLAMKLAPEGDRVYYWITLATYFIHQTPTPTWITDRLDKMRDTANQLVGEYGTFASSEVFYDLKPWRQLLGKVT
jgi:hypothetical protein